MFIPRMILLSLIVLLSGCASTSMQPGQEGLAQSSSGARDMDQEYRIGADDQLQVNVWRNPELTVSMPVRPDGMISMPLIGDVQAGDRTPAEVAAEIREKLSVYVREPNVTVIITELRSSEYISRVRITGAVQTPSSIAHRQGMTVLDAILQAGGVNEFAAPGKAKLYRKVGAKTEVYPVDLGGILQEGKLVTNYELQPGDIITVPERLF